jgi:hypothetical protein
MLLTACALMTPTWAQAAPVRQPEVIDKIVVVVAERVITDSDLRLSIRMDERDPDSILLLAQAIPDPLQRLIDRHILLQMAGKVGVYQPTPAEVTARLAKVRSGWDGHSEYQSFLRMHGLDEARLRRLLTERMVVDRYIRRNLSGPAGEAPRPGPLRDWMAERRQGVQIRRVRSQESSP